MAIKVPAIGTDGALYGAGLEAVKRMNYGKTVNVCSPEFGADPTGVKDSTADIQKAVDKVAALGGGVVVVPGGDYRMSPPFIQMKGYVSIRGEGRFSTRFWVDSSKVDSSTEETGVFHTGTYEKRITDPSLFRTSLSDFSIQVTYLDGTYPRTGTGPFQHIAPEMFNSKVWGICYNTYLNTGPAEPDSVHYFNNIEIWNTAGGVALLGLDDQGCQVSNIRIRKTWKQAFLVGKPGDHPEAYENNPDDASKPYRRAGGADNHFFNIDVSSANMSLGGYAGFEIYTSQCYFTQCKSWYVKRGYSGAADLKGTLPTGDAVNIWNFDATQGVMTPGVSNPDGDPKRFTKDGAGYYINGRDNVFTACMSQETGGHGWVVTGSCNVLTGCFGESPSFYDCVKNDAKVNEAVGFLFTNWCWGVQATGCISKNAYKTHRDARLGFFVQNWASKLTLRDCKAYDMPFVNGKDNVDGEIFVSIPPAASLSPEVYVDVNDFHFSNFSRDNGSGGSGGGSALAAPETTPAEIGSVMAHWDFSDTSKVTASNGRVSSVAMKAGTATDGTLNQADTAKQPYVSSLAGRQAVKTKAAELSNLGALQIGTAPIAGGWSVAMVVALASSAKGQYLFSSPGTGSKAPVAITTGDRLSIRGMSNGSSAGYLQPTADNATSLYTPAVVVMVTTSAGVSMYVNGVKSQVAPIAAGATNELSYKVGIGSYYDGTTGGSDATYGEVAAFSKALTDSEVSGLTSYLQSKWS